LPGLALVLHREAHSQWQEMWSAAPKP